MSGKINTTYDVTEAFRAIEEELIISMIRNLDNHRAEEIVTGYNWEQWQVKQLGELDKYKKRNLKRYQGIFGNINNKIDTLISMQRAAGRAKQEVDILQAIKAMPKLMKANWEKKSRKRIESTAEFFLLNDEKINALIKATKDDFKRGEIAILRRAEDQYRQIIFNAQMYAATGASYEKAVDMATKDFLSAGINCIEYKNGSRHSMADYADMALRTAQKRAYLTGEGEIRKEWGISTVIMNKRGNPCPKCKPFVGKVFIDDVWSGGNNDGISETTGLKYPLLSNAIKKGLYHPRCRDSHTTYFEGISVPPDNKFSKEELQKLADDYNNEQKYQYAKRQEEKYQRLAKYSLDKDNQRKYKARVNEWKMVKNSLEDEQSKRIYENKETIINTRVINSQEYRRRIDRLEENIKTKRSIWKKALEMLDHRSGTEYEDLAFVDADTGKTFINKSYDVKRQAKPNKKMHKMLKCLQPGSVIAIHNHPGSSTPSFGDIRAAHLRKYKYGIVVCHDGKIYKYSISEKYNDVMAIFAIERLEKSGYNEEVRKILSDAGIEMEMI